MKIGVEAPNDYTPTHVVSYPILMLIRILKRVLSSSWDVSTCPWLKGTLLSYALVATVTMLS